MAKTSTSFKKGKTTGRPKGAVNKTTKDVKQAYQMLIENNLPNLDKWLNEIAGKDPVKAFGIIMDLSEYVIPKLARNNVEVKGNDTPHTIRIGYGDQPKQVFKIGEQIIEF
jgi:hypothetical protein